MTSRKRELEKAVLAAFIEWAGADLPATVNTYTSRQKRDNGPAQVVVSCNQQQPDQGIDEYVYRVQASGAIICTALVDDGAPVKIEQLEVLAENFIEMTTTELLTLINAETETIEVTDIQPDQSEDGLDGDLQRYIARYGFTAFVKTIEPEEE